MQDCGHVDNIFLTIPLDQRMSVFTYMVVLRLCVRQVDGSAGRHASGLQGFSISFGFLGNRD